MSHLPDKNASKFLNKRTLPNTNTEASQRFVSRRSNASASRRTHEPLAVSVETRVRRFRGSRVANTDTAFGCAELFALVDTLSEFSTHSNQLAHMYTKMSTKRS